MQTGDVNGDGVLNNIEFYDVTDPTNGNAATYIYDNFEWSHCDADDAMGSGQTEDATGFVTGYLDGESEAGEDSSEDIDFTFAGGVNPTVWEFGSMKAIKVRLP